MSQAPQNRSSETCPRRNESLSADFVVRTIGAGQLPTRKFHGLTNHRHARMIQLHPESIDAKIFEEIQNQRVGDRLAGRGVWRLWLAQASGAARRSHRRKGLPARR